MLQVKSTATQYKQNFPRCPKVPDSLGHVVGGVSRQRIVQVPDEIVSVLLGQRHEGPAHHDELHLIHAVTKLLQL